MRDENLDTAYTTSRAIVVGIDDYDHMGDLGYAVSDAAAIANILREQFGFSSEHMDMLTDQEATRDAVLASYLALANNPEVDENDRLLFFFAGHGHTVPSRRGEMGFLIPCDGDPDDLSTLIGWDELTGKADLIPAKHILYIMDACYGGLAMSRGALRPGSSRFLKDMHLRAARQVLTAGKGDELVADSGGPRPDHSIFTGHLLNALEGEAEKDGVITANGVINYVYDKVSRDLHSNQSPHFGYLDGDGDFIFSAPYLDELSEDEETDQDLLVQIPAAEPNSTDQGQDPAERAKELLSDPKDRIKLHDLVMDHVQELAARISREHFPLSSAGEDFIEEFQDRLHRYEKAVRPLQPIISCIARWGRSEQLSIFQNALARASDPMETERGVATWNYLQWYPLILLSYSCGIAALSAQNYDYFATLLTTDVSTPRGNQERDQLNQAIAQARLELIRMDTFEKLPGHERHYTPMSEYLFKLLQPDMEDLLYLGRDYEKYFDRYEVIAALVCADSRLQEDRGVWGPVGLFGWKYTSIRHGSGGPLEEVIAEGEHMGEDWPLMRKGLFGGDSDRFMRAAEQFREMVAGLPWN